MIPFTGTDPVVIGEAIASVLPAGMKTGLDICACGRSLATVTTAPPEGAGWFSSTRASVEFPPYALPGSAMIANRLMSGGAAGDAATVIARPADHGPKASPCSARTRQK